MFFRFGQKPAFRVRELQLVMKMMDTIGFLFQFSLCTKRFLHRKNRKCANICLVFYVCIFNCTFQFWLIRKLSGWKNTYKENAHEHFKKVTSSHELYKDIKAKPEADINNEPSNYLLHIYIENEKGKKKRKKEKNS